MLGFSEIKKHPTFRHDMLSVSKSPIFKQTLELNVKELTIICCHNSLLSEISYHQVLSTCDVNIAAFSSIIEWIDCGMGVN